MDGWLTKVKMALWEEHIGGGESHAKLGCSLRHTRGAVEQIVMDRRGVIQGRDLC